MLELLLQRHRIILLIALPIVGAGIFLFLKLPVNMYPNMRKPTIMVNIPHPNYTAEDFHFEFSQMIEERLNALEDLDHMESTYSTGRTRYKMEFSWNTDFDEVKNLVQMEMNHLKNSLPEECEDFSVYSHRSGNSYMTVAVYSPVLEQKKVYALVEPILRAKFSRVKDAQEITVENVEQLKAEIRLRPRDMLVYGLTPDTVATAIRNGYKNISIGTFRENTNIYNLRVKNGIDTVFDIENLLVAVKGNKKVLLKDLADVKVFYGYPNSIYTANGEPSVMVYASPKEDGNLKQMSEDLKKIIKEAQKELPDHIHFYPLIDPSEFIDNAIRNVVQSAIFGAILAVFAIILFLGEWRNTLIIVISIPMTMLISFILMYFFQVTINLISLSGMTLAVGMVIDSSIVIMENIHRHRQRNQEEDLKKVILLAVKEVRNAVFASTLTSICVFFPLSFTAPLSSAILGDIARTVVFALSASLVTGLFLTPVLAYYFYRNVNVETIQQGRLVRFSECLVGKMIQFYEAVLRTVLGSKVRCASVFAAAFLVLLFLVIFIAPKITREIIAVPKSNRISVRCANYKITDTQEFLEEMVCVEKKILDQLGERVVSRYTNIRGTNWANVIVVLPSSNYLDEAVDDLKDILQDDGEWEFHIAGWDPASLPLPNTYGLHIQVSGNDRNVILNLMERISDLIRKENLYRGTSTVPTTRKSDEILLYPRENELEKFPQFASVKLAGMIRTLLNGTQVIKINEKNNKLNIYLEYPEGEAFSIESIMKYQLPYQNKSIPLSHFFDYEVTTGISEIRNDNGTESFNVYAYMNRGEPDYKKGQFEKIIKQKIKEQIEIPEGYTVTFLDTQKVINEAVASLLTTVIISIILIYVILGIQFNSLRIPLIVLVSIPLGLIGVIFFLYIAKSTISLNSLLGTILLSGIVVNNAIIIIDFYLSYRRKLSSKVEALISVAKLRFTPILITTTTTLFGMLPIAFAIGDSTNIVQPLGIAVSGGLLVSTLFTLVVIPVILNLLPDENLLK